MQKLLLSLVLFIFISCHSERNVKPLSITNSPYATGSMAIRWNLSAQAPLDLKAGDEVLNEFTPADDDINGLNPIDQMLTKWDDSLAQVSVFQIPANSTTNKNYAQLSSYQDSELGIYKSTNWFSEVSSSALAITQFFGVQKSDNSGTYLELIHADIIFNYKDFSFSTNANSNTTYDFHSVALHELGHFLGLSHQNDFSIPAVMQPYLSIFDSNRDLFTNDESRMRDLYDDYALKSDSSLASHSSSASSTNSNLGDSSPTVYRGIIELRENGECLHHFNGKIFETHFIDTSSLRMPAYLIFRNR